jgi:hypothetical protein
MSSEVTRLASASRWSHSEKLGLPAALGARQTHQLNRHGRAALGRGQE